MHHLVVPRVDAPLFEALAGPRCHIWVLEDLIPRRMLPVPRCNAWVNVQRPYPPIRGWIMQQLAKMSVAGRVDAELLLMVDSDVCFVRRVTPDAFLKDGRLPVLYRMPAGVHAGMKRHVRWHEVARQLLDLPESAPPLPDYVMPLNVWDRRTVIRLQQHLEAVHDRRWEDVIGAQLHFSEFILYGVFADEVEQGRGSVPVQSMGCHAYWDEVPLTWDTASAFLAAAGEDDIAVMISAKSRTPLEIRRHTLDQLRLSLG